MCDYRQAEVTGRYLIIITAKHPAKVQRSPYQRHEYLSHTAEITVIEI